jgi:MFS-type transporter involved in bile tolerance (Atg22 family)
VQSGQNVVLASMIAAICGSLVVAFVAGIFANYMKAEVQLWCLGLLLASLQIGQGILRAPRSRSQADKGHAELALGSPS